MMGIGGCYQSVKVILWREGERKIMRISDKALFGCCELFWFLLFFLFLL